MFSESRDAQHARLAARYAQAQAYLDHVADAAEAERLAHWPVPAGLTPTQYAATLAPRREELTAMLGYPPPGNPIAATAEIEEIGADADGTFYRLTLPLFAEGLDAYGLLIRPQAITRTTLAVAIHGGGGTPELAAGILESSYNYNDMGRRLARRGHLVWMPMCYERTSMQEPADGPNVHRTIDRRARLVGSTVSAIDLHAIIQSTAYLMDREGLTGAIAVGLSYGGFRALMVAALSELFVASVSSCYFNDRRAILDAALPDGGFDDWYFWNALRVATDVECCRLICPRPLFIEVGQEDTLFPVAGALRQVDAVREVYAALGVAERFGFDAFSGGHEFSGVQALAFLERMGY